MARSPPRPRKAKSMAALTALMTRFCAGEDSWLFRSKNNASDADTPKVKSNKDKSRRNRYKRQNNNENTEDTVVNAGFRGSKSRQQRMSFQKNNSGPSSLDRILDRSCQIHGTPDKPPNHTNRDCWVLK